MPSFDPRREPLRFAPAIATVALSVCATALIAGSRAEAGPSEGKAKAAAAAKADKKTAAAKTDPKAEKTKAKSSADKPEAVKVAAKSDGKGAEAKADKADAKSKTAEKAPPKTKGTEKADAKALAAAKADEKGWGKPQLIKVKLRKGETLEAGIRRAEASAEEAKAAAKLAQAELGAAPKAGQMFQVEIAPKDGRVGSGRVHKLTIKSGADAEPLVLARGAKGKLVAESKPELKLAKADAKTKAGKAAKTDKDEAEASDGKIERVKLVSGEVRGSLYGSARKAGVGGGLIGEIVKVFGAKLDLERDLQAGDKFKVVQDEDGKLIYAQIKSVRFHRFTRADGETVWLDEDGRGLKGGLLRTPVDGARLSSSFGMRRHPIFGYHRMHQGVDFAAASGTPIMAAGDGTVVEIRRWGGYGNWLRIKHAGGYESGYAHLSKYASGLNVGDKVRQGQLVAYVGSTGASTGPHLHHEIWLNGKRVDPKGAKIPAAQVLEGKELIAFKAQRKKVDAALEGGTELAAKKAKSKVATLRPKQTAA